MVLLSASNTWSILLVAGDSDLRLPLPVRLCDALPAVPAQDLHHPLPTTEEQSQVRCNGNSVYIFLFWEYRGLSPNIYIHVSLSDLYIPRISLHISSSRTGIPIVGIHYIIRLQTHKCGNWDWGPDIPFLGIFVSNFRHFVFAVYCISHSNGTVSREWNLSFYKWKYQPGC